MLDMFNVYKKSWIVTAGEKNCCRFELFNKERTHRLPGCSNIAGTLKIIVEVSFIGDEIRVWSPTPILHPYLSLVLLERDCYYAKK